MAGSAKNHGGGNGPRGEESRREQTEDYIAPESLPELPPTEDIVRECQVMNLVSLREVFASRKNLSRKEARGQGMVFRGVSGQLRALEFGQRE